MDALIIMMNSGLKSLKKQQQEIVRISCDR
jgi:hypothetical protein